MQLTDFIIHGQGKQKQIDFNDLQLQNLQDYLNQDSQDSFKTEGILTEYYGIRDNWNTIENYVATKFNGFWEEDELEYYTETGNWFTSVYYEDFLILVDVDNIVIYIYNALIPENPRVGLPLDEFIGILEQWKDL